MNKTAVAQELVKVAKLLSSAAGEPNYPYAVITIKNGIVSFRITPKNVTGSEPFRNEPLKALEKVIALVRKHGVQDHMVELLT